MSHETYLDRVVGAAALEAEIAGVAVAGTQLGAVTIRHGRTDIDTQPAAATCSLAVLAGALSDPPVIGDVVDVRLGADAIAHWQMDPAQATAASWRFAGHVTDSRAQVDGRGRHVYAITATSRRARLGRLRVGADAWPAELDGARAARILALCTAVVTVAAGDPGTVGVTARPAGLESPLALLDDLAADTGATLAELRAGGLEWFDAEHRRNNAVSLELDATDVISPASWQQSLTGMVNALTVVYGAGEPRPTVTVTDVASADPVTGYGPFAAQVDTQLADATAATAYASLMVARRGRPWWRLDALTVDLLRTVTNDQAAALLALEHGDLLTVTGFPDAGPFTTRRVYVEGWTETITARSWRLSLSVSESSTTAAPARWVDVGDALTWADVDPAMTWNTAASWDPGEGAGRWADYPSNVSWLELDLDPTTWAAA